MAQSSAEQGGAPGEVADLVAELLLGAAHGGVDLVVAAVVHRDLEAVLRHVEGEVLRNAKPKSGDTAGLPVGELR